MYIQTQNEVSDVIGSHLFWNEGGKVDKNTTELFMNFRKSRRCEDHQNAENENFRSYKIAVMYFRPKHFCLSCENSQ